MKVCIERTVVVDLFLDPLPSSPSSSPSSSSSDDSSNDTTAQNQKERRHLRALVSDVGAEIEVFKGGKVRLISVALPFFFLLQKREY